MSWILGVPCFPTPTSWNGSKTVQGNVLAIKSTIFEGRPIRKSPVLLINIVKATVQLQPVSHGKWEKQHITLQHGLYTDLPFS